MLKSLGNCDRDYCARVAIIVVNGWHLCVSCFRAELRRARRVLEAIPVWHDRRGFRENNTQ